MDHRGSVDVVTPTSGMEEALYVRKLEKLVAQYINHTHLDVKGVALDLWKYKAFNLAMVTNNGYALKLANKTFRADKDVVLAAVTNKGTSLNYADASLKADRDVVIAAVTNDANAINYAAGKKDRGVILAAVSNNAAHVVLCKYAKLKKDKEVVLKAVANSSHALQHADKSLQADRDVVLAAVTYDGYSLRFADASFKADRGIVLVAVTTSNEALQWIDDSLTLDKEIVLAALSNGHRCSSYAYSNMWKQQIDASFYADKDVVLTAVTSGCALRYADQSLKADKEVVLAAVTKDGHALKDADASLKADKEVVLKAVENDQGWWLSHNADWYNGGARDWYNATPIPVLCYADALLKKDKEVVLAAVKTNGRALLHADASMRADREIVVAAMWNWGDAANGTAFVNDDIVQVLRAANLPKLLKNRRKNVAPRRLVVMNLAKKSELDEDTLDAIVRRFVGEFPDDQKLNEMVEKLFMRAAHPSGYLCKRDRDTFESDFQEDASEPDEMKPPRIRGLSPSTRSPATSDNMKEQIDAIINEFGVENLSYKKVRVKLEEQRGLEAGELKSRKAEIQALIDECIQDNEPAAVGS